MDEKKSGLQKKVSSIFQGMPPMEDPAAPAPKTDTPAAPEPIPPISATPMAAADLLKRLHSNAAQKAGKEAYATGSFLPSDTHSVTGVDLGERWYKLLRLGTDRQTLEALAFHEWEQSLEMPIDPDEQQEILRRMTEQAGGRGMSAVLGLPADTVAYHWMRLPRLPKAEIEKALRWEMGKKGMLKTGEVLLDHEIISSKSPDHKLLILGMAAQTTQVREKIQLAEKAGLAVQRVATAVQALEGVMRRSGLIPAGNDAAVLELGFGSATLCFFHGRELQYARTLSLGIKDFLAAGTGVFQAAGETVTTTSRDALLLLQEIGMPGETALKSNAARAFLSQLAMRLRPVLENLVEEIRRSLEHYVNSSGLGPVTMLWLSGGAAETAGLAAFLSKELGMKAEALKPFEMLKLNMPASFKGPQAAFTVALGLALQDRAGLALLPKEYRLRSLDKKITRWAKVLTAAAIGGFMMLGSVLQAGRIMLTHRLEECRLQAAALAGPAQQCKRIMEIQNIIAQREKKITGNALRQPLWEGILKELSNTIPDNAVLTGIMLVPNSAPKTLSIKGIMYADNLSADSQLSAFLDRMALGPYFLSFDLASRKNIFPSETPASTFEMRGVLEY